MNNAIYGMYYNLLILNSSYVYWKKYNSNFLGKIIQNTRKHVDVKLVQRWENRSGCEDFISRPNFKNLTIFDENFVAVQLHRSKVKIDKPIYIGFCALDLSKTLMYRFHYALMVPKIGEDELKLMYMDTDSMVCQIRETDIYQIMKNYMEEFGTSDFSENNQFGLPRANKTVLGLMKVNKRFINKNFSSFKLWIVILNLISLF